MEKKLYLIVILFLISTVAFSQISGTVSDNNGEPLPGVNVAIANTNVTVATDFDGNFTIMAEPGNELEFTMVGFKTIKVNAAPDMKVAMEEQANALNEVVVIGYGSKKAGSITGSVVQIKAADIVRTPSQSAMQAIQGRAAGVNIIASDDPGVKPTVMIRGLSTISSDRNPLYIIDGVEANDLNLSPNEIATIDILKDASSLAIYGQKGSNGVIIVTTKKGKSNDIKVTYDTYYGLKEIQHKVKMADSFRYAYYNNSALGNPNYFNSDQPYDTDWFDEITQTGEVMNHYLSLAGASENASYYFGVTNYQEKGVLIGTQYERTNVSTRNEFRFLDGKVKINPNINFSIINNIDKPNNAFTTAYKQSPIVPVQFDNGRWGVPLRNTTTGLIDINGSDRFNNVGNPVADLYFTNDKNKEIWLYGSIGAEVTILEPLKFTSNFGGSYNVNKNFSFTPNSDQWLAQNPTSDIDDYEASYGNNTVIYNTLDQSRTDNYIWNWDNYFTFNKSFGKHDVTATLGMSRTTKNQSETLSGTRYNVPEQSNYWSLDLSSYNDPTSPNAVVQNSRTTPIVSIAYFARAEYEYDGKYLFSASARREGSSVFQSSKKWGFFPAVSVGWVISNEDFMKGMKALNYLKLRAGYGELGNARVNNSTNTIVFAPGYNYAFGSGQVIFPGNSIPYEVDPNLTWETVAEVDLGLDFKFINKLTGTFDVYNKKSSDLLVPINLPPVLSPGNVTVNAGSLVNKGVEATLRWEDDIIKDKFSYWISANFSYNENELTDVANSYFANYIGGDLGNGAYTKQVLVGEALGTFYVYEVTGFNSVGQFTYSAERVASGSYIPKYTYGLSLGANYENFDFSVDVYGVGGNKIYNGKKAQRFGGENVEYDYLNSFWTASTPDATNPYPYNDIPRASNYFIEDGSYLRINNITLGYTLPALTKQVSKIRIYATAVNPFVFTKYSGYSPEVIGNGDPLERAGVELDAYPTNKTFLFGLNVSL
jgi:TonB-linked SusC/RagA family outer membrane protein